MIDPYFFEDAEPGCFAENCDDEDYSYVLDDYYNDDYVYDTYDEIFEEDDFLHDFPEDDFPELDAISSGAAFAYADLMQSEIEYEMDENTDSENMRKAQEFSSLGPNYEQRTNLRPFERYVRDYIRRGCKHPD